MKKVIALFVMLIMVFSAITAFADGPEFNRLWFMQNIIADNNLYAEVDGEYLFALALREILDNHPELYELAARAMLSGIDENSVFRNREETRDWFEALEGEFGGIGVHVLQVARGLLITGLIPGGAAMDAGIMLDDVIIAANGTSFEGLTQDQMVSHVRGEVGSEVQISVRRSGEHYPLNFTVTRRIVEEVPVIYEILEDYDIMHLRVLTFNSRTDTYVEAALAAADEAGITKILLDLRNNAGGFMEQAVLLANRFVYGERVIVTERYREGVDDEVFVSSLVYKKYDVVVLVNERSASAAEVVAGAIADNEVGPVVGTRTFGKATIQRWNTMPWGESIVYTIAHYLTPNGYFIHGNGIIPDVLVTNTPERFNVEEFGRFSFEADYWLGSRGENVRLAREALRVLNIHISDVYSEYFDENLRDALITFQYSAGLYQSGMLCVNTQVNLYIRLQNAMVVVDRQFEVGLRLLSEM
ncbi:MAG: S41 family peptidase [Oscillospiraceae bacterium]|nr:S41 family peptidase [Oscillospiraceae bacterium]